MALDSVAGLMQASHCQEWKNIKGIIWAMLIENGGSETAAPCGFVFAFIGVIRGQNFGCGRNRRV